MVSAASARGAARGSAQRGRTWGLAMSMPPELHRIAVGAWWFRACLRCRRGGMRKVIAGAHDVAELRL